MTPATITAIGGAVAAVIVAWVGSGKLTEKRLYKENGFERRENTITRSEHELCRDQRQTTEKSLEKGQEKLEVKIDDVRDNIDAKIETGRKENRQDFQAVFKKLDGLTKEFYQRNN